MSTSISSMTEPRQLGAGNVPAGLLEVGVIRRPHGVKGDTYVDLVTDREDRLAVGSRLWARGDWRTLTASKRLPQRWLVHFQGFDDRTAIETLTNAPLYAEPLIDHDALWVHELLHSRVVEVDGTHRGTCVAVVANPAHDLLELDSGALVPIIFVVSCVDAVTTIDPPPGLFDLDS
jgi:16S rRNA processing protein RimM